MQRKYTKPVDSKECRPQTAGELIIENLKKDGDVIGIEVDGEKWSVEKLCRHEQCQYCENCPMHLVFDLEDLKAFYGQSELMVCMESEGCPLATVLIDEFLDPRQNTPEELACHEFAYGLVILGLGNNEGLEWIREAERNGSKEAKIFLNNLKLKKCRKLLQESFFKR